MTENKKSSLKDDITEVWSPPFYRSRWDWVAWWVSWLVSWFGALSLKDRLGLLISGLLFVGALLILLTTTRLALLRWERHRPHPEQ